MAESVPSQATTLSLDNQQQQPINTPITAHFGDRLRRGIAGIGSSIVDLVGFIKIEQKNNFFKGSSSSNKYFK